VYLSPQCVLYVPPVSTSLFLLFQYVLVKSIHYETQHCLALSRVGGWYAWQKWWVLRVRMIRFICTIAFNCNYYNYIADLHNIQSPLHKH
jgi:hypothetical protein